MHNIQTKRLFKVQSYGSPKLPLHAFATLSPFLLQQNQDTEMWCSDLSRPFAALSRPLATAATLQLWETTLTALSDAKTRPQAVLSSVTP